jgi:hypothetical protein
MGKKKSKKAIAKEVTQQIMDANKLKELEQMLKSNIIEWKLDNIKYRVRKPTIFEVEEVKKAKNKRYQELLEDDNYLFQDQLIEKLAKKGKSIARMNEEMIRIQQDIEKLQLKLAEYGKEKEKNFPFITELKDKIIEFMNQKNLISVDKTDLLSSSIESELFQLENQKMCSLVLEKEVDNKWEKVFKDYEEFKTCQNGKLMGQAGHYFSLLLFSPDEG